MTIRLHSAVNSATLWRAPSQNATKVFQAVESARHNQSDQTVLMTLTPGGTIAATAHALKLPKA